MFFLRYVETMSIIIAIVCNITVLVWHNIFFFGCFMPMSHGINKRTPSSASHNSISIPDFHQVCLHYKKYFINLLLLWSGSLQKVMHFQRKFWFWFSCFVYMCFLRLIFFFSSAILNYKYEAVVIFSDSKETKFEIDTTSIILSYRYHFGNAKKELFRYC